MTKSPITSDIHQPLDMGRDLSPEIPLHFMAFIDNIPDMDQFLIRQIFHPFVYVDAGLLQDLHGGRSSDSIDIGQSHLDPLVPRQIHPRNSCQFQSSFWCCSTLTLFMPGIIADHANNSMPFHHFTLRTNPFY